MTSTKKRLVACPQCKQSSEYSAENPFRPFCSERCKLIDLGVWATEGYAIPTPIKPDDLTDELTNQLLGH
ncbi:MAG TPA: DNA gyrase inhibitor YacG [Methylotenera sp.]|nr:DNA gyrase inhibitor YacG [Methylotenera sp.]HPH05548.1 DNA gyrase inhibitor YacG [Methylotenera sp.]HPN00038.1 DNA gyrase inhibitor YacG [Methylotenera sp.]